MIRFLFRFLGYWLLAAALVMIVVDGTKTISQDAMSFTPLGEIWFRLAPITINQAQFAIEENLGQPWLWDLITQYILTVPGWAVFGVLAFFLLIIGRKKRRPVYLEDAY